MFKTIPSLLIILLYGTTLFSQPHDFVKADLKYIETGNIRLHHKIIPLSDPVYQFLDYLETGKHVNLLPMSKPYTRITVVRLLSDALQAGRLTAKEQSLVQTYLEDLTHGSNSIRIYQTENKDRYAVLGFSARTEIGTGIGQEGTWQTNLIAEPFVSGDFGQHISFSFSGGPAFEHLAPDYFEGSYTKDGDVYFPYDNVGYAALPYQFDYITMWSHVNVPDFKETSPIHENLTAALIYHTELNMSWFNNTLQINIHNRRRAWGFDQQNLVLSSTARSFPGIEFKIEPVPWLRYSYLTGSLFSYESQSNTLENIYGYDIGQVQKNFTNHLLELILWKNTTLAAGGSNIWSKRFEMAYLVPFMVPHLAQIEVGDHDNLTLYFDAAVRLSNMGKLWGEFFVDEFGWEGNGRLFLRPRNRYGWQLGWQTNLLSHIIPFTTAKLRYTRLTPYVYTHYPETDFNPFGNDRPLDMTYTHDGSNLGFYLPPNSAEWNLNLTNFAFRDLVLSWDTRYIRHGTNDLSNMEDNLNFGDVYRYQRHNVLEYPEMNLGKDGIYDYSVTTKIAFDFKVARHIKFINFYHIVGSIGYGTSWWKSNNSGIRAPKSKHILTSSIGVVVDM
ncbi:hypothetical protein [Saccharicrinis sp. FJH54]|uniref:hypothetical protein n=1 Tax=Saccharicrinis sp. FJH54 TaxID=3344665 RepID=UPI0035D51E72